jgi:beta-lactam-binding protein with PASTA domain
VATPDEPGLPDSLPAADPDQSTLADGEWPVAEQYRVTPDPDLEPALEDERGAVAVGTPAPPWVRTAPLGAVVVALVALLLLAGAATGWLVTHADSSAASPSTRGSHEPASSQPTTPHQSGGPGVARSTGTSTSTSASSTTTSTTSVRTVAVPEVLGLRASEAAHRLRKAELVPRIRLVESSRQAGTVLDQRPHGDQELDVGSAVLLEVAKERPTPPAAPKVAVPRLVGSQRRRRRIVFVCSGLHWTLTSRSSERTRGTVLEQDPPPGSKVEKGVAVTLTVSSGPSELVVPDVTGLDAARARAQLADAGFDVTVVDQPTSDPDQDGVVVDQSPESGSSATKGSTVTITVARVGAEDTTSLEAP